MTQTRTLYDKHIDSHTVCNLDDQGHVLLYIDRQVINEYTSPQAFSGLREAGREVWRPSTALAVVDHVNPTAPVRVAAMADEGGALQVSYLEQNCEKFGIELFDVLDKRQGIEHVVAPEQGFILPGMVIAAGDSHTTTYGALGAFGFGIGTSEIEHLLASQTLVYKRLKSMRVTVEGDLASGITSKDVIMALIGKIGASGATGYAIEFAGSTIDALSVEARMTICNMAVEAGARGAFMAPDDKVFDYLKSKPRAPKGKLWDRAVATWRLLHTDPGAHFDSEIYLNSNDLEPMVTWGTSPDSAPGHGPSLEVHGPESRYAVE
jgi:3-isopropylmalate/(R)-2-methylmalate dehydratase large subunit